jgi:glycosyltransferase involved in cell wall biosynthesis
MNKISIVTINLNNRHGLESTIKSVLAQSVRNFEFVIIDGNSNDGSIDVIERYAKQLNFWQTEKDNGIYDAQNKGILKSTGEYILFLNSGDVLADSNVIENLNPLLHTEDIVYGNMNILQSDGTIQNLTSPSIVDVEFLMISTLWHPTSLIKRSVFSSLGLYNTSLKICGDYEFFIRAIVKHGCSLRHIPITISTFNLGGISNQETMKTLEMNERQQAWLINFSPLVVKTFQDFTSIRRSSEYKWGNVLHSLFKPFK